MNRLKSYRTKEGKLNKAIRLAVKYHAGQEDLQGNPYIFHPLRVMLAMTTEEQQIVAVLHDIIEDTVVDARMLLQLGYSAEIIEAILALTRKPHESYEDFIQRVKLNPIARIVKLADLDDNLRPFKQPNKNDIKRAEKYRRAILELLDMKDIEETDEKVSSV